jgi:glycine/serine hydroxymethyltransferase
MSSRCTGQPSYLFCLAPAGDRIMGMSRPWRTPRAWISTTMSGKRFDGVGYEVRQPDRQVDHDDRRAHALKRSRSST